MTKANGKSLKLKILLSLPLVLWSLADVELSASAQIVPDKTLPNNTIITPNRKIFEITGGTTAGSNLFHSFEQFSLLTGKTAFFNNPLTIENIITRVTGGSISNIDGVLRANGNANLFLINPNGIIFGPNASLNIGGSFIGSTANSIRFADGSEFSATNPQNPPLLKINVPVGLQYGVANGGISVLGLGNNIAFNQDDSSVIRDFRPVGLQVQPEKTLAFVGGNVVLEGGNLTAQGGRIELGSVGSGLVKLNPTKSGWTKEVELISGSPVTNSSGLFALVNSGATGNGGNIIIDTDRLLITGGAQSSVSTFGLGNAGSIYVKATNVELTGASPGGTPSGLFANVELGASGAGGNITIDTQGLRVADGARITTITFDSGNAGTLMLKATDVELIGASSQGSSSGLFANVESGASGNGGNIIIDTERLRLSNGGQIGTVTLGSNNAGNLTVRAFEVELIGSSAYAPSSLFTTVGPNATGSGGNLTVETGRLRLFDGGQIATSTAGSGKAGNLTVNATDIELTGLTALGRSGLFASAVIGTGDAGNLAIATDNLTLLHGATISASNFSSRNPNIPPGQGKAGNIQIIAGSILLDSTSSDSPSSITASTYSGGGGNIILKVQGSTIARNGSQILAETKGSGNGGSVNLTTNFLKLTDSASISTNSTGSGSAGNVTILADKIQSDRGKITATSNQTGGGDINLTANLLLLRNQSLFSTSVLDSTGGGGNITINSDFLVASQNSDIRANAVFGTGGNIQINTKGVNISPDSEITASSQLGVDGVVKINTPDVDPTIGLVYLPQGVIDATKLVAQSCSPTLASGKLIVTGRGGMPPNPSGVLSNETVLADLGTAAVQTGKNDSSSAISTHPTSPPPTQIVEAQGWVVDANGQVTLTASAPKVTPHSSWLTNAECNH